MRILILAFVRLPMDGAKSARFKNLSGAFVAVGVLSTCWLWKPAYANPDPH
jgi:hypothetical protein